jgi:hypothetical protein
MSIKVESELGIRVIDSLNFLPMKLAALPKAFGLDALKKGDFPHYFNVAATQDYVGPYPDPSCYGVDGMKPEDRRSFLEWHGERVSSGAIFDFRKEILEYCRSDVDILKRACVSFRNLMMDVTSTQEGGKGVDPFR